MQQCQNIQVKALLPIRHYARVIMYRKLLEKLHRVTGP